MKIYCDKCGKEITDIVNKTFEENKLGNINCPHCGQRQKRYISETDLLMYLSFQETVYFSLSFLTSQIFKSIKINLWIIITFIFMFALAIVLTAKFKSIIYNDGLIKKDTMYKTQIENQDAVAKSIRWQFLLFFALVITFFTEAIAYWFFVAASIVAIGATIIKTILASKNEKN